MLYWYEGYFLMIVMHMLLYYKVYYKTLCDIFNGEK